MTRTRARGAIDGFKAVRRLERTQQYEHKANLVVPSGRLKEGRVLRRHSPLLIVIKVFTYHQ